MKFMMIAAAALCVAFAGCTKEETPEAKAPEAKPAVEKLLMSQDWRTPDGTPMTVEEIIKEGLKRL